MRTIKKFFGSRASLGGASNPPVPGQLAAAIFGNITLSADLQQNNKIGTALSATLTLAAGLIQNNVVGAAVSGTISIAGDLTAAVPNDMKFWFNGLPFDRLSAASVPSGGVKQWFNGLPVDFIS